MSRKRRFCIETEESYILLCFLEFLQRFNISSRNEFPKESRVSLRKQLRRFTKASWFSTRARKVNANEMKSGLRSNARGWNRVMFLNIQHRYSLRYAISYVIGNDNTGYGIGDRAPPRIRDDEGRRIENNGEQCRAFAARLDSTDRGSAPRSVRPREQPFAGG